MSDGFDDSDNLFTSMAEFGEEAEQADESLSDDVPDFGDLFEDGEGEDGGSGTPDEAFQRIDPVDEEPKPYFKNAGFYQDILKGEGENSKRLHQSLAGYLKAQDAEDKSAYRSRIIPMFWELARSIATKAYGGLPVPKKLFLRFGILLPTLLSKEQRVMFARIIEENRIGQPIHYVDEWLAKVAKGEVSVSATDETNPSAQKESSKVALQVESVRGKVEAQAELIRTHNNEMEGVENSLTETVRNLTDRSPIPELEELKGPYDEAQRSGFGEISHILRRLSNMNKELSRAINDYEKYRDQLEDLKAQAEELGEDIGSVDTGAAAEEMGTVRQMAKLAVGRQGNHFPIFTHQYFRSGVRGVAIRENVNNVLAEVEYLDPGLFQRTFKQKTTRIVPNIVLVPCYGDFGICWEPFERFNRATSRGRIAIPMYPKDLKPAVIAALGDLRWQVAKEKAAHYWMEEGLTGWYYQWFAEEKLKGDVKDKFVEDYILWISKESEGTQKLAREVRDIFWRYIPFPQEIKDKLNTRGFVYSELYKKDANRARSDGY